MLEKKQPTGCFFVSGVLLFKPVPAAVLLSAHTYVCYR